MLLFPKTMLQIFFGLISSSPLLLSCIIQSQVLKLSFAASSNIFLDLPLLLLYLPHPWMLSLYAYWLSSLSPDNTLIILGCPYCLMIFLFILLLHTPASSSIPPYILRKTLFSHISIFDLCFYLASMFHNRTDLITAHQTYFCDCWYKFWSFSSLLLNLYLECPTLISVILT